MATSMSAIVASRQSKLWPPQWKSDKYSPGGYSGQLSFWSFPESIKSCHCGCAWGTQGEIFPLTLTAQRGSILKLSSNKHRHKKVHTENLKMIKTNYSSHKTLPLALIFTPEISNSWAKFLLGHGPTAHQSSSNKVNGCGLRLPIFTKTTNLLSLSLLLLLLLLLVMYGSHGGCGRRTVIQMEPAASRWWRHIRYGYFTWLRDGGSRWRVSMMGDT